MLSEKIEEILRYICICETFDSIFPFAKFSKSDMKEDMKETLT